jgi:hypothetical protein
VEATSTAAVAATATPTTTTSLAANCAGRLGTPRSSAGNVSTSTSLAWKRKALGRPPLPTALILTGISTPAPPTTSPETSTS